MINLASLNAERKARIGQVWISVPLNDREPYRFRSTVPADIKGWFDNLGLDDSSTVDAMAALVDPVQQAQFRADCADSSIEYGIDSVTLNRVNQALTEIYAGKETTASSSHSSPSPTSTVPS